MALTLEIVTPEARVYADTIDTVVIPTTTGEIGILSGHIPLLTQIEHGELRVTKNGVTTLLAVSGGFAQVEGDRVSVLAEHAITEEKSTNMPSRPRSNGPKPNSKPPKISIRSNTNTSRAWCATAASNSPSSAAAAKKFFTARSRFPRPGLFLRPPLKPSLSSQPRTPS